jgi:hypothetical protein
MKRCFIITFDLKNPGMNQDKLVASIKTATSWARLGTNSFVVSSDKDAAAIREIMLKSLYQGDKIYIGKLDNSAAWYGLGDEVSNWLRNNQK